MKYAKMKRYSMGAMVVLYMGSGLPTESAKTVAQVPLYEQIAHAKGELQAARAGASLGDKMSAYFSGKRAKKPEVKRLVDLADAEWQLRKKMLQQQKKNRVQLFINRHEQELRMALIALGVLGVGGIAGRKAYVANKKAQEKRERGQQEPARKKFTEVLGSLLQQRPRLDPVVYSAPVVGSGSDHDMTVPASAILWSPVDPVLEGDGPVPPTPIAVESGPRRYVDTPQGRRDRKRNAKARHKMASRSPQAAARV